MVGGRVVLGTMLSCILVACSGGASLPTEAPPVVLAEISPGPTQPATPQAPSPSPTPRPTPKATPKATPKPTPTPVPVPPKPTGVKFHADADCSGTECSRTKVTQTVLWKAPRAKGVEIRVYGVTECLAVPAHPKPGKNGPCLVEHTSLPGSVRTLLAKAPASAGWVSWSWTEEDGGCDVGIPADPVGPGYYSVVIAAYSASGHSIFVIAEPGGWWEPEPGDMAC